MSRDGGQTPDLVICVLEEARTDLVVSEVKDKDGYKARCELFGPWQWNPEGHGGRVGTAGGGSALVVFLEVVSLELLFRDQQKCGYWKETVCHWRETASVLFKPRRKFLEKSRMHFSPGCSLLERWVKRACPCHQL